LAKPISTATQNALNLKENAINKSTDVTLSDVSNVKFPTELAVKTFVNGQIATNNSTLSSAIIAVQNDVDANELATTNALALKEDAVNKSTDVTLADVSNTKFPTELAVKTFVNGQIATNNSTLNAAITAVQNDVDANELATTNALALKEDAVNKSSDVTLGDVSNTKFPTELAVKTYVTNQIATGTAANVSGIVAIANGGTGSSVQNFVDLSTNQAVAGEKTFGSNTAVNANLNVNGMVSAPVVMVENGTFQTGTWGDNQWQSFTATSSGVLSLISIFGNGAIGARNGTLNIYSGTGTTGAQLYSGSVALPPFSGWFDLPIASSVSVVTGNVYTFQILDPNPVVSPGGMVASVNNLYPQGDYFSSVYGANSNYDLTFKAWVSTVVGGNITASGTVTAGAVTYPNTHGAANQVLTTNGSGTLTWSTPANSASSLTGTLAIANGGTGSSVQNFVDLTNNQSIDGSKIFSSNGFFNTQAIGKGNASGGENLAVGAGALNGASTGTRNTAVGNSAMQSYVGTSFDNNTSVGYANLVGMTTGSGNTSVGAESLMALSTGISNTSIGNQSLINTTGSNNVGVGKRSGDQNNNGNNNTFLGTEANVGSNNLNNSTSIGFGAVVNASNAIQLGNDAVTNVNTYGSITANAEISSEITTSITISNSNAEQYKGKVLVCNPSSEITIIFENNLPVGFNCMVLQKSLDASKINFAAGSGVTLKNRNNYTATAGNYAIATIVNIGGGIIVTAGDMQ
jgi:predicted Holliday junction resolvase-like endonuclease